MARRSSRITQTVGVAVYSLGLVGMVLMALLMTACGGRSSSSEPATSSPSADRELTNRVATKQAPWILLVTLDTTRADHMGYPEGGAAPRAETPTFDALARRGHVFEHAYATAPMTLPSHVSMMTGLYPSEHGVHENARYLSSSVPVAAEQLDAAGYATAAFVSGYPLARAFGLGRGFDHYDDQFVTIAEERDAGSTTDRALDHVARHDGASPLFLWVHYFDAHDPYEPPEPFRERYAAHPYSGEIAYVDHQLGRLIDAFEQQAPVGQRAIVVVGDHGEGLGEHGEALHGNLLFQGTIRVPLAIVGPGVAPTVRTDAVSVRHVHDTVLGWAGLATSGGLLEASNEPVMAEALRPFLQYGWQPQVMAVFDGVKVIRDADIAVYDLGADPDEQVDVAGTVDLDPAVRAALRAYPIAPVAPASDEVVSEEARARLASLGYAGGGGRAPVRDDAPNPRAMTAIFEALDHGSRLFAAERYTEAMPVLQAVLDRDPNNLMATVRLAVAHSVLDQPRAAIERFAQARALDPASVDVRHYQAMHHLRARQWDDAAALFEAVLAQEPGRLPALEGFAHVREAQGRIDDALALLDRATQQAEPRASTLARMGNLHMRQGRTAAAITTFEQARAIDPTGFAHALELGVLYLADRRVDDARHSLDAVPRDHPGYAMALFKRAQVSVLLDEPDRAARIRQAYSQGDATIRGLIEHESLFAGVDWR